MKFCLNNSNQLKLDRRSQVRVDKSDVDQMAKREIAFGLFSVFLAIETAKSESLSI